MSKLAIITGICGQDGPFLAQFLLDKGYHVVGTTRSVTNNNEAGLQFLGIRSEIELIEIKDFSVDSLRKIINIHKPRRFTT